MKSFIARALALLGLALPLVANAAITVWEYEGSVTEIDQVTEGVFPADVAVGSPFRVRIEFDTDEQPSSSPAQGGGTRYNYNNVASLRFNIFLGATCIPCVPEGSHGVIVRDNVPFPFFPNNPGQNGPAFDGYTFTVNGNDGTQIQLNTRGPILDIVGGGWLPEAPDPRLADLVTSLFQVCVPNEGCLSADVTAVNRRTYRTTWEIQGTIDEVGNSAELEGQFQPGERFRMLFDFETETVLAREPSTSGSGKRYDYSPRSMSYRLYIGDDGPFDINFEPGDDSGGSFIVRDDAVAPGPGSVTVDGYSSGLVGFDPADGGFFTEVGFITRGPVTDIVNGQQLPDTPDSRIGEAGMSTRAFQVCRWQPGSSRFECPFGYISGTIDSVSAPAFGANYFLSARDCMRPTLPSDPYPDDCVSLGSSSLQSSAGGGFGRGEFVEQFAPTSPLTGAMLGSAFGSVSFSGPITLPVVKGSSFPSATGRTNANLQAYQLYRYEPANPTSLPIPLIVDLTYSMGDYSSPTFPTGNGEAGLRPGGATLTTVLAIVDADRVPMSAIALANFNGLQCGNESTFRLPDRSPWPAGSIMGAAVFTNPEGQQTDAGEVTVPVQSCSNPGQSVQLSPGQRFVVVTSMQSPARGLKSRLNAGDDADANGYVDSANTMRVKLDPAAPPALLQALADSIEPECVNCGFVADVLEVAVDVKPGSEDNAINPGSIGLIPVALLGSEAFDVRKLRLDGSLRMGTQGIRIRSAQPQCSVSRVNADAIDDLVCHFENASSNWTSGQLDATVTGQLFDGTPIEGSDHVRLVR